jgi:hypothetical protein
MPIGNIALVNIGQENIYLVADPQITYFKTVYKRYTNFSIEPIPQYFKTTPDFGRRCTINISKNADLLSNMYIYIELPTIKSNNNNIKFKWANKIGLVIVNFVEIEINGNIIDRHYGDWINIWNEISCSMGHRKAYDKIIGNVDDLNNYSYTKNSYILYIPLSFWFCLDSSLAIPLISLYNCNIKIHVDFNDINKCYNISPSLYLSVSNNYCLYEEGELFYQLYQNNKIIGEFVRFDPINKLLYYNPIKDSFQLPSNINNVNKLKLIGMTSNYEMTIKFNSTIVQNDNYYNFNIPTLINSYLLVNYIYLDNFERNQFLNNNHEYIIQTVQTLLEQNINSVNSIYKIPFYNCIKLIVWRTLLLSNYNNNNFFNYTSTTQTLSLNSINNSDTLINNNLLVLNSVNSIDLKNIIFYTNLQCYQYELINNQKGIYIYSFALDPKSLQPSGNLNFNKIEDAYIQLTMNNIVNYQNQVLIKGYGIQYNLLKISNGISWLDD